MPVGWVDYRSMSVGRLAACILGLVLAVGAIWLLLTVDGAERSVLGSVLALAVALVVALGLTGREDEVNEIGDDERAAERPLVEEAD